MIYEDRLILARKIAADACALDGNSEDYCKFMREGAYDDNPTVMAAFAGLKQGARLAMKAKSNVVSIAPAEQVA